MTSAQPKTRPFDAERTLRAHRREELDLAFGGDSSSVREEAQELAYQALEAEKRSDSLSLARKALALDGECTDAQLILARVELPSPRALAKQLRLIASRSEAKLGAPFLQQYRGGLWGIAEARPYLRAKFALADALEKAGKSADAILHLEALLTMDPSDPLGARVPLVRCYLSAGKLQPLESLLKARLDSAFFAWATVLARLKAQNEKAARKALEHARKVNPAVEEFITGRQKLPRKLPEFATPGSPEEAAETLKLFGEVWSNDREALYWLFKQDR